MSKINHVILDIKVVHPYFSVGKKEKLKFGIDAGNYLDYNDNKIIK